MKKSVFGANFEEQKEMFSLVLFRKQLSPSLRDSVSTSEEPRVELSKLLSSRRYTEFADMCPADLTTLQSRECRMYTQ